MDHETARLNMIEQQIRPWNVLEMQTLGALGAIRREDFVPPSQLSMAFADVQIPLTDHAVMLEPKVSARMMEALHLTATDRVLEIGTGSGYLTALMASVCFHVTSIEIDAELKAQAERNLGMAGISNCTLIEADGHEGWGEAGEFDAVLISGSCSKIAKQFIDNLSDGGRLVGIEGHEPAMQAVIYRKLSGDVQRVTLFETFAPRLTHAEDVDEFVF